MAFNSLEYLEAGNIEFVYRLTPYDYNSLIKQVRESDRRINIVNGFLPKLKDSHPCFCFDIIYDMDEFSAEAQYLLDTYYSFDSFTKEKLESLLNGSCLGYKYLEKHFYEIIDKYQKDLDFILKYLFSDINKCMHFLKVFAYHYDLHIRFLFMKYLIVNNPQYIFLFYDDITKYLTSETHQALEQLTFIHDIMDMKDVCELAFCYFDRGIDYQTWLKFKKFILDNYQYNELAYRLLQLKKQQIDEHSYRLVDNASGIEEFNKDADTLFTTSSNYRISILNKHSSMVSREILEAYRNKLRYFERDGRIDFTYKILEDKGLGRTVEALVDKCLSLSKDTTYSFLEQGTTATCYRIGDYVVKLVRTKWSYEQVICPDLYLILPNIEEVFIRDDAGIVLSGVEVQKYLKRSARDLPLRLFTNFSQELNRLGYYTTDTLIKGPFGDNCRLLDSYRDSGNPNPPGWFKRYPIVLVDRDRVYRTDNKRPKQLSNGY